MAESAPPGAEEVRAAGAVLWRPGPAGLEVALVHRPRYDDWSFPKGKLDPGEHVLAAAVRELVEETGIVPRLGRRLPTARYQADGRPKRVDYWAATVARDGGFEADDEVDVLEWLPADAARARLSYAFDRNVLAAFLSGPAETVPLVVLRHASAVGKRDWRDGDELRPLDERGRAEATALATLLAAYDPARVVSSATARCVETVLPYVNRVGRPVETHPALTVGEGVDEDALIRLVTSGSAVLCTHGEIVPTLVKTLCAALGATPPPTPTLRKSEFWVAHLTPDTLASLEHHTPL